MKYIFILLTVLSFSITDAQAQRFGHIDTVALLDTLQEAKDAELQIANLKLDLEQSMTLQQESLATLEQEIREKEPTWGEFTRQEKYRQYQEDGQRLQEYAAAAEQTLYQMQETLMAPIREKIRAAIKAVGAEQGFTYIFDLSAGAVLYDGGEDVMPLILAKMKEMEAAASSESDTGGQ